MKSEVSVIVPAYNAESNIRDCVQSILSQSFNDIELIVVNDGSVDDTQSILESIKKYDSRLKIINQKNQSVGVARTNGVLSSEGSYISFVDSDDTIHKDMIQIMYKKVMKDKNDIVVCNFDSVDEKDNIIKVHEFINIDMNFENILSLNINPASWNKIYKRELFFDNNIKFKSNIFCEDLASTMELFYFANKIGYINQSLYNYYINPNGASNKTTKKNIDHIFVALETNRLFLVQHKVFSKYQQEFLERVAKQLDLMYKEKELSQYIRGKLDEYKYFNIQDVYIREYFLGKKPFIYLSYKAYIMHKKGIKSVFIYGYGEPFVHIEQIFKKFDIKVNGIIETQNNNRKIKYDYGTLEIFLTVLNNANIFIMSGSYFEEISNIINIFTSKNKISIKTY